MTSPFGALSLDDALTLATRWHREGQADQAEGLYGAIVRAQPDHFAASLQLGILLEQRGNPEGALACYETAIRVNPGHALAFTRRALILLRRQWGSPIAALPPPMAGTPRIGMSSLGSNGRFGNQLLQYAVLRLYGAEHGISVETPDWIGRDLFELNDPWLSAGLVPLREEDADLAASLNRSSAIVYRGVDVRGYFAWHTAAFVRHKALFQSLFRLGSKAATAIAPPVARLRARGRTLVALHIRHGDFGYGPFWIAPSAWYRDWLQQIWTDLDDPVLYLATDDPTVIRDFVDFRPISSADLMAPLPGAEFLLDFEVLAEADVVAIANSSFSRVASMLNNQGRCFMRPNPDRRAMVAFDPWDSPMQLSAEAAAVA
ncbi:MAG: tetratricopeptide repeat protein [Azospirillaceae bacterium]|nr:tetratricopeptide repeat protein [Azospirillaceae bacterium]